MDVQPDATAICLRFKFLVEHELSETFADTFQVGDDLSNLFDGLNLFAEIFVFQEVTELNEREYNGYLSTNKVLTAGSVALLEIS